METLLANVVTGRARRETLHGRSYLVAPATLINPGVLNGSKGPGLYETEEIGKDPTAWNYMPIVVYHPTRDGQPVSGRTPDIIEKQWIGNVFNAQVDSALKSELWFDVEATRRVDTRVLNALEKGEKIELSTGLNLDMEPATEGAVHNAPTGPRPYAFIARRLRPDHLAILPDAVGACSVQDGCGVFNETNRSIVQRFWDWLKADKHITESTGAATENQADQSGSAAPINTEPDMALSETQRTDLVNYLVTNCDCWKGKEKVLGNKDAFSDEDLERIKAHVEKERHVQTLANGVKESLGVDLLTINAENMSAAMMEKCKAMMAEKKMENNQASTVSGNQPTLAELLKSASPQEREVWNNAVAINNQQKAMLTNSLRNIADTTADTEKKELIQSVLNGNPDLKRLQEVLILTREPATNRQEQTIPNFFGAGMPTQSTKDDSDNLLPILNVDFDEMASPKLRRKQA